ncbi:hypothetical protein [Ramlibacter tataouinensis]|uniref:Candidate membrane protein n=1 Tax=Ramlibacter tataouinensis (strain ATCC BAA-407 / DSM 14655 / LMG 21543 / TTB310) TaxID=365046 RepID=F5Y1D3_RAMTT|nr:hypothetical protein [Ramlibacter tataouinensis]AEG94717.1 Conserved hypothetical protein [Ramlibacter tataouinensis TTB310]
MWQYVFKVALSAAVIVAVSELARRSSLLAAALASLPLTSLLALVWLHLEGGSGEQVAQLAAGIGWLVLPSLVLFVVLPLLLRAGWGFWPGLAAACAATVLAYAALLAVLSRLGMSM